MLLDQCVATIFVPSVLRLPNSDRIVIAFHVHFETFSHVNTFLPLQKCIDAKSTHNQNPFPRPCTPFPPYYSFLVNFYCVFCRNYQQKNLCQILLKHQKHRYTSKRRLKTDMQKKKYFYNFFFFFSILVTNKK